MISQETQDAVCHVQRQVLSSVDFATQERGERALDELLRHPENTLPEHYQRRNAIRHARWGMMRQGKKSAFTSLDDSGQFESTIEDIIAVDETGFGVVDVLHWLDTSTALRPADRALLGSLASGHDADTLAVLHGIPVRRMRERISRARSRAWAIYQAEVLAA
ncbi:hypothetical protein ACBI99_37825 [Nonomuraea sp. ATR24]|uniref:hypothetical protein n=1 Tax=Nonomuraea sp. ATR24 TaxID=1676744 RepID=UPI0035C1916D